MVLNIGGQGGHTLSLARRPVFIRVSKRFFPDLARCISQIFSYVFPLAEEERVVFTGEAAFFLVATSLCWREQVGVFDTMNKNTWKF